MKMRDEQTMLGLILNYASAHDDIRVVVMNGSRVNPQIQPDPYQDYDIIYFVREVAPFRHDPELIAYFGRPLIVQLPHEMGDPPPAADGGYRYLMQFRDGTRIDLGIEPLDRLAVCLKDSLTRALLDKDGLIGKLPPPSEDSYLLRPPTRKQFDDCCNEFWWLNPYVAKGLLRGQLVYVKHVLDMGLRNVLLKMLCWYAGLRTEFKASTGLAGKNLQALLEPALWRSLKRTYVDWKPSSTWRALFEMQRLFRKAAVRVAAAFGFSYPEQDDSGVTAFVLELKRGDF